MSAKLLIVESPSKAKPLKKYLGKEFEVLASYGHVRDLIAKNGAVDTKSDFAMKYEVIARNSKYVEAIASAVKEADTLYLATDPDREGEAISWHLLELLSQRGLLEGKAVHRVVFHEITQSAVLEAVANPREVSLDLVNAQQARRALDYLVGFNLSPLLWKKIRRGLSAGRVQSPALRLIVERENEIRAFQTREYWTVHLTTQKAKQAFEGKLVQYKGEKLEQFSLDADKQAAAVEELKAAGDQVSVTRIEKKRKQRSPAAPFTTSTLQQEAVRKLGMTTDRAMRAAQNLYEGIDVGQGIVGLITYMRTDSVALAKDALEEIRAYIGDQYTADYLPKEAVVYRNKTKNAQEAHEAIRPTSVLRTPESVKSFLTVDQARLYEMIWKRTVASQMTPAQFDTVSVDLAPRIADTIFRATGQTLAFPGFIDLYREDQDDTEEEGDSRLPPLVQGEELPVKDWRGEQHFTQPPPRYTEASIVKALEEFGIGRPSTYVSIISTLKTREYVLVDKKRFQPTDTGEVVNKFLTEHFSQYVDYNFTANLEDELDRVSNGELDWIGVLRQFWDGFSQQIDEKQNLSRKEVTQEELGEACPKCSKPLSIRFGKRGKFIGCSAYPECDYTRNLNESAEEAAAAAVEEPVLIEGRSCPKCSSALTIKQGPYGKFIGCTAYPKCKFIEPLEKPKDTGVSCPECKKGMLIERKSRYGKLFYSCNTYPDCKYATWNPPINEPCPKCAWPILTLKTTKRRGTEKVCPQKECGYAEPVAASEVESETE